MMRCGSNQFYRLSVENSVEFGRIGPESVLNEIVV